MAGEHTELEGVLRRARGGGAEEIRGGAPEGKGEKDVEGALFRKEGSRFFRVGLFRSPNTGTVSMLPTSPPPPPIVCD